MKLTDLEGLKAVRPSRTIADVIRGSENNAIQRIKCVITLYHNNIKYALELYIDTLKTNLDVFTPSTKQYSFYRTENNVHKRHNEEIQLVKYWFADPQEFVKRVNMRTDENRRYAEHVIIPALQELTTKTFFKGCEIPVNVVQESIKECQKSLESQINDWDNPKQKANPQTPAKTILAPKSEIAEAQSEVMKILESAGLKRKKR